MGNGVKECGFCLLITGFIVMIIVVPLGIAHVEYYEYGIIMRKTTGYVDTDNVYRSGRHYIGPSRKFLKYQADSHLVKIKELAVFSSGGTTGGNNNNNETSAITETNTVGLPFQIDVSFTYLLIQDEIGELHQELANAYESVIESRAKDAIKNKAAAIPFTDYFLARNVTELAFREAVQQRWDDKPSLHCTLDQFHLGRIRIPDTVAEKQLESKVQNERNDMENYLQQASLEREQTNVEVNMIGLQKEKVLRTAQAYASLVKSKARSEAAQIIQNSQINGTKMLFDAAEITNQEQMTAFTYIRTLMNRNENGLSIDVSYLSEDNVLKTTTV